MPHRKALVPFFACVAALATLPVSGADDNKLDPKLQSYTPVEGVSGNLTSMGSDTMNNIMTLWTETFTRFYPNVKAQVEGKGSSTAPPALTEGQAQFGPMSRQMKDAEEKAFEERHGYKPTLLRTGIDCLAVYVHRDNPLEEISLEELELVFSVAGDDMTWGDLGVTDPDFARTPVSLYGRNSASGTYGYFKKQALRGIDYKPTVKEQPGSSAVVQAVGTDIFAMGYSGLGYMTQNVKALRVSEYGEDAVLPNATTALSGEYPLTRYLYVYINRHPSRELDPLRREFIRLIFSREGQEAVLKDGYVPLPAESAEQELVDAGVGGD